MHKKNTRTLGKYYEIEAMQYLLTKGYEIIEQNWQCGKIGEIDFIIIDRNRFKRSYLVFVEVKYRFSGLQAAKEAVNYKKQLQIKKLSQLYLKSKKISETKINISYDVIAIGPKKIEHIKDIFQI